MYRSISNSMTTALMLLTQLASAPASALNGLATNAALIAKGQVSRFTINPMGEIDGLLLGDGTLVAFPPHMTSELAAGVHVGGTVSVQGLREDAGTVKAWIITYDATQATIVEHPPLGGQPPLPPQLRQSALIQLAVQGNITRDLTGPRGDLNGVLLEDGSVVRFPPEFGVRFSPQLRPGASVAARGLGTQNQYGRALEATAIGPTPDTETVLYVSPPGLNPPSASGTPL